MAKKLTLNETWKQCLRMWKWIVGQLDKGRCRVDDYETIDDLKHEWVKKFWKGKQPDHDCFFCWYANNNRNKECDIEDDCCKNCPGKLVSPSFDCIKKSYHFRDKPRAFYRKLLQLDAKRKKQNSR